MKNGRMTICLVCVSCLTFFWVSKTSFAYAIVSEQHRVYGYADGAIWFNSYDISGTSPLDHTGYGEAYDAWGSEEDEVLWIATYTKAGNLSIETSGLGADYCLMTSGASSIYELVFNTSQIEIYLSVFFHPYYSTTYEGGSYSFVGPHVDDSLIWDESDIDGWWGAYDYDGAFVYNNIIPGEIYTLQIASDIVTKWSGEQSQIMVDIIPEPCTLLLLGIGGLLIRKRTQQS